MYIFLVTGGWCQHCFTHNASLGWDPIRHFPTEMVVLVAFGQVSRGFGWQVDQQWSNGPIVMEYLG